MQMQTGEQFRDDLRVGITARVGVAAEATATGRQLLPADELRELTTLSGFRSALALAQTVLVTSVALGAAILWPVAWVMVPAILIVATQQHAMFVLAHEAAHYRLFANRRCNDWVGRLLGAFAGLSM